MEEKEFLVTVIKNKEEYKETVKAKDEVQAKLIVIRKNKFIDEINAEEIVKEEKINK